ncbi:MAG: YncE family protein, partial [Gammaproteobacteria bacterium]
MTISNFLRRKTIVEGGTHGGPQRFRHWIPGTMPIWKKAAGRFQIAHASVRVLLLAPVLVFASWITGSALPAGGAFHPNPQGLYSGPPRPSQSSPIALSGDDVFLSGGPNRIGEVSVGRDPVSVAIHPGRPVAYVANSQDGTISVVDLPTRQVLRTLNVGAEPSAVAFSPNGTRLYVANSASNNLMVINPNNDATIATVDLSPFGTAPRAIGVTNDGDNEDSDETIFVPLFFAGLRAGKTATEESQDDQREGRVVAISAASNSVLAPNPILLQPLIDTGFNSNGRLAPGPNQVPNEESFNPQTFLSRTDAFPNQLAAVAIHPTLARAYV